MSQPPGIGSSRREHPPSESTYYRPVAGPFGAVVQETVLNPEGRRRAGDSSHSYVLDASDADPPSAPVSLVWKRLFPADADTGGDADLETASGSQLGHFAIEDRIGAGGMGAVFRALDTRLQRVVALKVLAPGQSRDRAAVLRFQNEARAAARLDHENIARVYYFGEDRGLHFIAFEYVTGQNVRDLIARTGRLPVADAVNYTMQIAAALRHTAAAGVVHRDIKPSNIIIAPNGRAKLVDLGLARKLTSDSVGDLTVVGTTLGTFDYISPEQARDPRSVDVRSDIYSLGCTLYHMLTGGPPYSSGTVLQKLLDHQSGQPPDPRSVNPEVPPALSAVCRKMMAGDPKNRHATPDELIRELSSVAAGYGLRPLPAESYVWRRPHPATVPKIRPGVIWAISAAVVVLLAMLVDRWPATFDRDVSPSRSDVGYGQAVAASQEQDRPSPAIAGDDLDDPALENLPPPQPPEPAMPPQNVAAADTTPRAPGGPDAIESNDRSRPEVGEETGEADVAVQASPSSPSPSSPPRSLADDAARVAAVGNDAADDATAPEPTVGSELSLEELTIRAQALVNDFLPSFEGGVPSPGEAPVSAMQPRPDEAAEIADAERFAFTKPFVLRTNAEPQGYDTLAEAVENSYTGDTIELHFDGRLPGGIATASYTVDEKSIEIVAGDAPTGRRYRPLIEFVGDGLKPQSNLFVITGDGASLTLDGVELRMEVAGEVRSGSNHWALFSLSNAEQLRLRNVAITLINPDRSTLSVVDLRPPEGISPETFEVWRMLTSGERSEEFLVEMRNCFVRGEGGLVTIAHTLPGRIDIADSAFALKSALLNVTGGLEQPPAGDTVRVVFDQVTAVLGGPLLQVEVDQLPRQVAFLRFEVSSSLFAAVRDDPASSSSGPLVLMTGNTLPETFMYDTMLWTGRNNVFDGYSQFWSILTENGGAYEAAPTTFELWRERWKGIGSQDPSTFEQAVSPGDPFSVWLTPHRARNKSRLEITPGDLALDPDDSRGVLETPDGIVGAEADSLPPITSPPDGVSSMRRGSRW